MSRASLCRPDLAKHNDVVLALTPPPTGHTGQATVRPTYMRPHASAIGSCLEARRSWPYLRAEARCEDEDRHEGHLAKHRQHRRVAQHKDLVAQPQLPIVACGQQGLRLFVA